MKTPENTWCGSTMGLCCSNWANQRRPNRPTSKRWRCRQTLLRPVSTWGWCWEKQGHTSQAIAAWAHLTGQRYAKDPVDTDMLTAALNHIGRVHENNRDYRQALEALEHSLLINPKQAGVIQHWVHIRQKACEWPVYKPLPGITKNEMIMATSPLAMLALTDDPLLQLLSAHAFVARTYGLKEERLCKVKQYHHPKKTHWLCIGRFARACGGLFAAHHAARAGPRTV